VPTADTTHSEEHWLYVSMFIQQWVQNNVNKSSLIRGIIGINSGWKLLSFDPRYNPGLVKQRAAMSLEVVAWAEDVIVLPWCWGRNLLCTCWGAEKMKKNWNLNNVHICKYISSSQPNEGCVAQKKVFAQLIKKNAVEGKVSPPPPPPRSRWSRLPRLFLTLPYSTIPN